MLTSFYKYEGAGNDFILIENTKELSSDESLLKNVLSEQISHLCKRHHGIGADGVLFCSKIESHHWRMQIYNADGSRATMCGNGLRCCAAHLWRTGVESSHFYLHSDAAIHEIFNANSPIENLQLENSQDLFWAKACFGIPLLLDAEISSKIDLKLTKNLLDPLVITSINYIYTGVEHLIFTCSQLPPSFNLKAFGKFWRQHSLFPSGTNVSMIQQDQEGLSIQTYERGVEDITRSCGTAACAAAASYFLKHSQKKLILKFPLEPALLVELDEKNQIWLIGPARFIFEGSVKFNF
jgi:diaminopimelate epimerase